MFFCDTSQEQIGLLMLQNPNEKQTFLTEAVPVYSEIRIFTFKRQS